MSSVVVLTSLENDPLAVSLDLTDDKLSTSASVDNKLGLRELSVEKAASMSMIVNS